MLSLREQLILQISGDLLSPQSALDGATQQSGAAPPCGAMGFGAGGVAPQQPLSLLGGSGASGGGPSPSAPLAHHGSVVQLSPQLPALSPSSPFASLLVGVATASSDDAPSLLRDALLSPAFVLAADANALGNVLRTLLAPHAAALWVALDALVETMLGARYYASDEARAAAAAADPAGTDEHAFLAVLLRAASLLAAWAEDAGAALPPAFWTAAQRLHAVVLHIEDTGDGRAVRTAVCRLAERLWAQKREQRNSVAFLTIVVLLVEALEEGAGDGAVRRVWAMRECLGLFDWADGDNDSLRELLLQCFTRPLFTRSADNRRVLSFFLDTCPALVAKAPVDVVEQLVRDGWRQPPPSALASALSAVGAGPQLPPPGSTFAPAPFTTASGAAAPTAAAVAAATASTHAGGGGAPPLPPPPLPPPGTAPASAPAPIATAVTAAAAVAATVASVQSSVASRTRSAANAAAAAPTSAHGATASAAGGASSTAPSSSTGLSSRPLYSSLANSLSSRLQALVSGGAPASRGSLVDDAERAVEQHAVGLFEKLKACSRTKLTGFSDRLLAVSSALGATGPLGSASAAAVPSGEHASFHQPPSMLGDASAHASRRSATSPHIRIPALFSAVFADVASPHTAVGLECGAYVYGTERADDGSFTATTLLLPPQSVTNFDVDFAPDGALSPDGRTHVPAIDYFALDELFAERGLVCGGWIHTHPPPHSCFMSSVDLHSHAGMVVNNLTRMPRHVPQVAIVVAPLHTTAAYVMSDAGVAAVRACNESGFHDHDGQPGITSWKRDSLPFQTSWYNDAFITGLAVRTNDHVCVVDLRGWDGRMTSARMMEHVKRMLNQRV
jgi:hypothetical protein